MERQEWLKARQQVITATDIGAIAGLSPYRGPHDVWLDKMGMAPEWKDNPAMDWGRRLEGVVAERYAQDAGVELLQGEFIKREWMGGTPDRLVKDKQLGLEVKTAGLHSAKNWGEDGTDEVPDSYAVQCHWYMALTGFPIWDIAVLIGGQDYRTYRLRRDDRIEKRLIEIGREFHEKHVLAKVAPPIDGSNGAADYLRSIFPKDSSAQILTASPEVDKAARALIQAKARLNEIEAEIQLHENAIKAAIGEASGVRGEGWKVSWKKGKDALKVDWKAVAATYNAEESVVCKYTTVSPAARRFLLTVSK